MPDREEIIQNRDSAEQPEAGTPVPEATWIYTLSEEEIYQGLRRSSVRRAGPVSDWVRTGILAVVAAGCLVSFIVEEERDIGSLLIALAALALIAVLWITPPLRCRHIARQMAQGAAETVVCMFENGVSFGGPREELYAYTGFYSRVFDDMIVCELPGYQLILIPRRAVEDDGQWTALTGRLKAASAGKGR